MTHVYNANFNNFGFDVNVSGYGETVEANTTSRAIPWSGIAAYAIINQVGGLTPITRSYQATVYSETDYGALRSQVGLTGQLTTAREGPLGPGEPEMAYLSGIRRGNYQYPAWPAPGDGSDVQTIILDFIMLQT